VVSVSYNSPGFLIELHHLEGALRAPFDAVESIVEAVVGPQRDLIRVAKRGVRGTLHLRSRTRAQPNAV
jgi:hypothetical protein